MPDWVLGGLSVLGAIVMLTLLVTILWYGWLEKL